MQLNNAEEIYNKIKADTGKSDSEVQELISKIKEKYQGLLSDVGANIMVAKQLNVDLNMESTNSILKIKDLESSQDGVSIYARVKFIPPVRKYKSKDGSEGRVQAIYIQDETGSTKLNLWQDKVDLVGSLKLGKNSLIFIKDAYVTTYKEKSELSLRHGGVIIKDPQDAPMIPEIKTSFKEVSDIDSASEELIDTIGRITNIYPAKEFEDKKDPTIKRKVLNFQISDGIKNIRCVAWDPWAGEFEKGFKAGDLVKLSDVKIKDGLYDLELYINWNSSVTKNPETTLKIPPLSELLEASTDIIPGKIESLEDGNTYSLEGVVVTIVRNNLRYFKCPKCNEKIQMINNEFICENCNEVVDPVVNLFGSIEMDDGTGVLKVVFFRDLVENLFKLNKEDLKKDLSEDDKAAIFGKLDDDLLGKKIKITGNAKLNNFSSQIEFIANTIEIV